MKRLSLLLFLSFLSAACGQNVSYAADLTEPELYRLQPGELLLAASDGDIPALIVDQSHFVPAEKADLEPEDLVVGLLIGDQSRAYPVRLLSLHEVVNDHVNDLAVAVTWCPLCFSAVVYEREIDGVEHIFRASGYLLHDNLVLIDHPTDTLWSQLLGQGIKGAERGTVLRTVPSTLTTWEIWENAYPDTYLLFAESVGYPDQVPDPYAGYFASGAAGLGSSGEIDPRLPAKTLVFGISISKSQKAYPLELVKEEERIEDQVDGTPITILWDEELASPRIIRPRAFSEQEYPGQIVYWFAWSSLYPETAVFSAD